jgi:hypothetical protein
MEAQAIDNDVSAARNRIRNPECDALEAERLREKIHVMSEEKFYGAQSRMNELREEAAKLTRPIFERLTVEFDRALQAIALQREEELTAMGIRFMPTNKTLAASITGISPSTAIRSSPRGNAGASAYASQLEYRQGQRDRLRAARRGAYAIRLAIKLWHERVPRFLWLSRGASALFSPNKQQSRT